MPCGAWSKLKQELEDGKSKTSTAKEAALGARSGVQKRASSFLVSSLGGQLAAGLTVVGVRDRESQRTACGALRGRGWRQVPAGLTHLAAAAWSAAGSGCRPG